MERLILKTIKSAIKHWYIPLIVGLLFVAVSILAFTSPQSALLTLAFWFSLSFLLGGVSEIIFSIANRDQLENWGWSLGFGAITFIAGMLLLINSALSVATLAFFIGFVVLFRSIAAISFAMDIKNYGSKKWGGLLALGILGTIFSFILIWNPRFAGMTAVVLVALNFLVAGLFSIYFALQLKQLHTSSKKLSAKLKKRFDELAEDIREEWGD